MMRRDHKIPVVIIDSGLERERLGVVLMPPTTRRAANLARRAAWRQLLNGKGKVLLLPYAQGSASTEAREKPAFSTAMKKNPRHHSSSQANQYGGPTTETRPTRPPENLLTRYGSQTDGVFASNETNTRGLRLALKDKGLLGKVKFVGFDAAPGPPGLGAQGANELQGLVVQNPFKMGYTWRNDGLVDADPGQDRSPRPIDTGVALVTAGDA